MKKAVEFFEGTLMTVVSGVFLAISLVLMLLDVAPAFDPAWITAIISGIPLIYSAIRKLFFNSGISRISSALLISIAMIAAIAIGDIFAAGEVAFIMAIGEVLEDKTTERAKKGLKRLIGLAPQTGRIITDNEEKIVTADIIAVGDIVRVLPGEVIPVDGEIIGGETSVDQSVMTGESIPVDKETGDSVFCGTINRFGAIDIRATKVGEDSSLQKLIRMVKDAENKKAPMHRTADKWASYLVPVALIIAIIAYIATRDIVRAVTVLVVFCPCALVLATPTAIMAAIGQATKYGVIIKSGEALEKMGQVDTVAFDKTGTLTCGKLEVSDVVSALEELDEDSLLALAATAEIKSEHPLGKAIVASAKGKKLEFSQPDDFKMEAGKGVFAKVMGQELLCGSEKFLAEHRVEISDKIYTSLDKLRNEGKASVLVAADGKCIGIIALSDILRDDSSIVVSALTDVGTDSVLLTGDNRKAAEYFAKRIGLSSVYAELLPQDKVAKIDELQNGGRKVCMIGDGVNDAPALKCADVGVAMGGMGSDIAVEAADIALMRDDISQIPYLKRLSNATVKTIKFSIALSLFINLVAIILSLAGLLNPITGALVHNAGSCFVVLIATLLYDRKFE